MDAKNGLISKLGALRDYVGKGLDNLAHIDKVDFLVGAMDI